METVTVTYAHLLGKGLKIERTISSKPLPSTLNPFTIVSQPPKCPSHISWMRQPSLNSQENRLGKGCAENDWTEVLQELVLLTLAQGSLHTSPLWVECTHACVHTHGHCTHAHMYV